MRQGHGYWNLNASSSAQIHIRNQISELGMQKLIGTIINYKRSVSLKRKAKASISCSKAVATEKSSCKQRVSGKNGP